MSRQAQRMVTLAGASWSFDRASKHLKELCGWSVSDKKIREVCHERASLMAQWQRENPKAHQAFREAQGDVEFCTDGTMVNTTEGWREMRLGIFAKRPRGLQPPRNGTRASAGNNRACGVRGDRDERTVRPSLESVD